MSQFLALEGNGQPAQCLPTDQHLMRAEDDAQVVFVRLLLPFSVEELVVGQEMTALGRHLDPQSAGVGVRPPNTRVLCCS